MTHRVVNAPGYVGSDRRHDSPPPEDSDVIVVAHRSFKSIVVIVGLVGTLVAWGVSWGTAKAQVDGKVNVTDQLRTDTRQDLEREALKFEVTDVKRSQEAMTAKLDSIYNRVTQIACDGKPISCR